jgi:hAT family C-terminal dimerisation region
LPLNTLTLTLQSPKLTLSELPVKIQMATCRLREIETDRSTYVEQFKSFISQAGFPTLGRDVNYSDVHKDVVVKYIQSLCKNMDKRFGDSVGQISVAATIFKPDSVEMSLEDQLEKVGVLADHFKLNKDSAANEWLCFRRYMDHRKNKNGADIFNSLLVSDLSDAFPELAKLAGIIMVSPIGTAGVERSFSTMSRLCNKLRQRLTPQHLS